MTDSIDKLIDKIRLTWYAKGIRDARLFPTTSKRELIDELKRIQQQADAEMKRKTS